MSITTRWRIPPVAWIPIALAIGAESLSNGLRAYKLGSHLEGSVELLDASFSLAGAILVLAAIAISFCQARAAWVACAPGDRFQRIIAGCFACLFLTISVTALHGHIADAERGKVGDEATAQATYDRATAAYKAAVSDYEVVKTAATPAAVQAQMDALDIDPKIRLRTKNCVDVTTRASQDECQPVTKLKPALAAAQRKAEIESKLPELKASLDKLKRPELASKSDITVSGFWGWMMGLGVVAIATFGAVLFAKVETVEAEAPQTVETVRYVPTVSPPDGGNRRFAFTKQAAAADVIRLVRENGSIPRQETLSERWRVGKGTVSKWLGDFERAGMIQRETVGRCKSVNVVPLKRVASA